MGTIKAAIKGVGGFVPEYRLTNAELEKMVDTNDEWIQSRTGIQERRILKGAKGTSDLAAGAIQNLLEKTNTDPAEVDLLICATTTPDRLVPDTATGICYKTGLENAMAFQLNAACSGFIFAITTAAKFIESGTHKKVIVVGADKMSSIINYKDRATCILFGDGGGAVLLEPDEEGFGVRDSLLKNDGSGLVHLNIKAGGSLHPNTAESLMNGEHLVYQNGKPVFKAAVSGMSKAVETVMSRNNLSADDVNWVVPHQANKRIIESVARMAKFPMERVMVNIHKYGNTTAATIPLCLWDYEDQLKKGDNLILTAFGGGYTMGAVYVKWAY